MVICFFMQITLLVTQEFSWVQSSAWFEWALELYTYTLAAETHQPLLFLGTVNLLVRSIRGERFSSRSPDLWSLACAGSSAWLYICLLISLGFKKWRFLWFHSFFRENSMLWSQLSGSSWIVKYIVSPKPVVVLYLQLLAIKLRRCPRGSVVVRCLLW